MALSANNQKEIEADIHEQLYTNILILTCEYPTSKEFNAYFKRDMFVKNNKAAFLHVMHFLLTVLDPELFKQRIMWPILDGKMEAQFRTEVMKYLNELNMSNKETGIPILMPSHLISPGGYKFAEFIFRLSQFVLLEYINRNKGADQCVMFPPKADSECSIAIHQVTNWNKIVDDQISSLARNHMAFDVKYIKARQREKHLAEQTAVVQSSVLDMDRQISEFCATKHVIPQNIPELEQAMQQKLEHIQSRTATLGECCKLMDYVQEQDVIASEPGAQSTGNKPDLLTSMATFLDVLKTHKSAIKGGQYHQLSEHLASCEEALDELDDSNTKCEEFASELQFQQAQLEEALASYSFSGESRKDGLSRKINEIFERIQSSIDNTNC